MDSIKYRVYNPILKSKRFKLSDKKDQSQNNNDESSYREYNNTSNRYLNNSRYHSVKEEEVGDDSIIQNFGLDGEDNNNLDSIYLPNINNTINSRFEEGSKTLILNKESYDRDSCERPLKTKLPLKIQLLKKDIQDRTLKAKRNLSVISRNLRNLKVLKSPNTRHIDQKRESLPIDISKLNKAHRLNQNQKINIRISESGLKYVNSETSSEYSKTIK